MEGNYQVILILLSILWLLVGIVLGYVVRGAKQTELLEYHNERLLDLLVEEIRGKNAVPPAKVRDTEAESPEAVAQARISAIAVDELASFIAEQGGVSVSAARAEAEHMLGQFEAPAQDMPEMVKSEQVNF